MWFQLSLLLLFGAVLADQHKHRQAWYTDNQYQYHIQSRTLASLNNNKNVTGIQFKGVLTIQASSPDTLIAKITKPQYAHVDTELSEGWETIIPDETLRYREFLLTELPFQIKLNEGVIQELLFEKHVPIWEVNFVKSIVSQLQVDTQKKNIITDRETLMPNDDELSLGSYKVIEASVGGKCEVVYDINLAEEKETKLEFDPLLNSDDAQQFIAVKKLKNYNKCTQQNDYSYGFDDRIKLELKNEDNNKVTTKLSAGLMILYGNLKRFTIYSSTMRNNIYIKSKNKDIGTVHSQVILSLNEINKRYDTININLNKLRSAGNLVYSENGLLSKNRDSQSLSEENNNDQNSDNNSNKEIERPLPKLNEVPDNLMMTFFNDYKTQNFTLYEQFDAVEAARQKILEIADEIEQFHNPLFENTLEKYTILVNLLRVLNIGQFDELKQRLNIDLSSRRFYLDEYLLNKESIVWDVLFDAIGQSGTGPALLAVTNWLKGGNLNTVQTIQVLTQISNNARAPTSEYVKAFFDLITHPKIRTAEYINRIAPVAFGELVSNAELILSKSKTIMNLEQDITKFYIPHMEEALAQAVRDDNSPLVQSYIAALGSIGHSKVLSVFEPYLEGQKKVTEYERLLMVRWLYKLVVKNPEALKNVLYKIYLNEQEAYEVRCMAVYLYFLANPSLTALTRMAKFTNNDKSEQVNSAVKSGIISLSKVNRPDLHLLIENARVARKFLTPKNYDFTYSQIHFTDKVIAATIGSKSSDIPAMVILANNFYSSPKEPVMLIEYALSDVDKYFNIFQKQKRQGEDSPIELLARTLNIKFEESRQLKGNVFLSALYGKIFCPFDKQDVLTIVQWLITENLNVNYNHLYTHDRVISSPTESGLPFTYTEEIPTLVKLDFTTNTDIETTSSLGIKVNGKLNAVVSGKIQRRFGFSLPFKRQQYQTGIDTKWQVNLPVEYEQKGTIGEENKYNYELKLRPISQNAPIRLLHYSTVPFSTRRANLDFRAVSSINNTNIINLPHQGSLSYRIGTIYVSADTNKETPEKFLNLASQIKTLFNNPDLSYSKFDVYIDEYINNKKTNNEVHLKVDYKQQNKTNNRVSQYQSSFSRLTPNTLLERITDKKPNSEKRQNQILKEVSKHIKSAEVHVYDVSFEIPSLLPRDLLILTIGRGKSYIDSKSRVLFYWNRQSQKDEEIQSEALIIAELQSLSNVRSQRYQNFNETLEQTPIDKFMIDMLIGDKNKITDKIQIEGNFTQSDSLREMIMNSKVTQQCEKQRGNNKLSQCLKAIQNAQLKDNLKLSINTNSERYKMYTDMALEYLSDIMPRKIVKLANPRNIENNTIDLEIKPLHDYEDAKISVNTQKLNMAFITPISFGEQLLTKTNLNTEKSSMHCFLKTNEVSTFDGKYYKMNLENEWQIMMLPVSETGIPENMKVAVAVRRTNDNTIQTSLMLGNHEIILQRLNETMFASIKKRETITFPPHTQYVLQDESSEIIAEMIDTTFNLILVNAPKYGLFLSYNDNYVDIQLQPRYRNKIRGLCGNYDRDSKNDFLTPDNCIMQDAREFLATYTLTGSLDSPQNILHKTPTTNSSKCLKLDYHLTNVISDREAGRLTSKPMWVNQYHQYKNQLNLHEQNTQENWQENVINRTQIMRNNQHLCFSLEPVPTCLENSKPVETKLKEIAFHCMPKIEAAYELMQRIQQGANPNMSDKSLSLIYSLEVPTACRTTN